MRLVFKMRVAKAKVRVSPMKTLEVYIYTKFHFAQKSPKFRYFNLRPSQLQ